MMCPTLRRKGVTIRDTTHEKLCLECGESKCFYDKRSEIIIAKQKTASAKPRATATA